MRRRSKMSIRGGEEEEEEEEEICYSLSCG